MQLDDMSSCSEIDEQQTREKGQAHSISNNEALADYTSSQSSNNPPNFTRRLWKWSGFGQKSLWDFLQFFAVLIPILIFIAEQREANRVRTAEQQESNRIREEEYRKQVLSGYLEQMTTLLLENEITPERKVQVIVRSQTLTALRQIDGKRRGEILRFLYEAGLMGNCQTDPKTLAVSISNCQESFLNLRGALLDGATIRPAIPLQGIDLTEASMADADFPSSDFTRADMRGADLENVNLSSAILTEVTAEGADLTRAKLSGAFLTKAQLDGSNLRDADLSSAKLQQADLENASLINANLTNANLQGAILRRVDLRNADLSDANLQGVSFASAVYNEETIFPAGFALEAHLQLCTTPIDQECESLK